MERQRLLLVLCAAALVAQGANGAVMAGGDPRVDWSGRHTVNQSSSTVSFDWLGVSARVSVQRASYVRAVITSSSQHRGTRIKVYISDHGFPLYPQVQLWVPPAGSPAGNGSLLFSGSGYTGILTLENIVAPQYDTGITTVHTFETDGEFVTPSPRIALATGKQVDSQRNIEFIGDSITAATNVVRPEFAPSCGDGGYQSDWSQTYEGRLCHRFGASCSTVAVGGKCVMRECGGLQMPDYFTGAFYADKSRPTYNFKNGWKPDAMVIDLGTNDMRAISQIGVNDSTGLGPGMDRFASETLAFMQNATKLYDNPDMHFFLTAGPMENLTITGTEKAINQGQAAGLKVTLIDMRSACAAARLHANSDLCDGCAGHPGIEGHRMMYEAAWPVISKVMGWN